MLTIIADANVSHLNDYFNSALLGVEINLITMAGRDINAHVLATHQPDALLVRSVTKVNADLLADNNSVKYVGSATIGTDHIDMAYLTNRGICFANASGCSKHSVAQYVITASVNLRPQLVKKEKVGTKCKIGIIGLGNIGSTLAKYANDLGWQVLGYDPLLPKSDINNCNSLEELLSQSDVVSLHVPLTSSDKSGSDDLNHPTPYPTRHLINEQTLAMLKPDALLINSARGAVIKESALIQDILENKDKGRQVVLDVFEHEPVVSAKLLSSIDIATPHIAGYSLEGKLRGTQMIYEAMCTHFELPIKQQITNLLPHNPYHWQNLLNDSSCLSQLDNYYRILKDDADLRAVFDNALGQVNADDFDALRKNYSLRREWQY